MVENVDVLQDWVKPWKDAIGSIDELLLQKDSKPAQKTKFVKKCVFWSTLVLRPCVFFGAQMGPPDLRWQYFYVQFKAWLSSSLVQLLQQKVCP